MGHIDEWEPLTVHEEAKAFSLKGKDRRPKPSREFVRKTEGTKPDEGT